MTLVPLEVVKYPHPPTTVVVQEDADTEVFADSMGDDDYVCGACGTTLMTGVARGKVLNLVIRCAGCGAFNATE